MIAELLIFYLLEPDDSIGLLKSIAIQHDQKNLVIPQIGSYITLDYEHYVVKYVWYNYDNENISVTLKAKD